MRRSRVRVRVCLMGGEGREGGVVAGRQLILTMPMVPRDRSETIRGTNLQVGRTGWQKIATRSYSRHSRASGTPLALAPSVSPISIGRV